MKVVAINGSPRHDGNTAHALSEMCGVLRAEGIDTEILQVGGKKIHGCIACYRCWESEEGTCVFNDDVVNEYALKMRAADGLILGAPTYYAGIPGDMKSFLDRVFFSGSQYFRHKVGTVVASVRRTGGSEVMHQLMHFLELAETVTPPSQYWMVVYGMDKGEAARDAEGIQTVRRNARAMAWLLKMIDATKDTIPRPDDGEERAMMNFIR
jgi:multimeric flavodoxin WrbA